MAAANPSSSPLQHTPASGTPLALSSPQLFMSSPASSRRELGDSAPPQIVSQQPGHHQSDQPGSANEDMLQIWGTRINVNEFIDSAVAFFTSCTNELGEQVYIALLEDIHHAGDVTRTTVNVDMRNVHEHSPSMYRNIVRYPQECVPMLDMAVHKVYSELFPNESQMAQRLQVRPHNLKDITNMRLLNPEDINCLIAIRGMVIQVFPAVPDCESAYFECSMCKHGEERMIDRGRIDEPTKCANASCQARRCMRLIHNRCTFKDKQLVKVQATPESVPSGETPQTVSLWAYDSLVDVPRPGDRVEIVGIYRAAPSRVVSRQRSQRTIYRTYMDLLHIKKVVVSRLRVDEEGLDEMARIEETERSQRSKEEHEARMKEIGNDPDIYNRLVHSLAPSIWEMDDIKKGVLCQLFGGVNKSLADGGHVRGEINVLLVGDPGTSKSQLLSYVHQIAPRGIYTSGKGSSAVGLTAYVKKDPETKDLVLESGALVLSDKGICCIDEFDKMSDGTRAILHEAMEQQTISVAKAGIICTLNCRTSILAAANPVQSSYNPSWSVVKNIQLPPTLLSRFDLIYLVLDRINEGSDRRLAQHLVSLFYEQPPQPAHNPIVMADLTDYISYARAHVHPVISDEAMTDLVNNYVSMRQMGISNKTITATPRQLDALIRLSEAHARMRLSEKVERMDVAEAVRLMNIATQSAATDPSTGLIDMDLITTGRSAQMRELVHTFMGMIQAAVAEGDARSLRFGDVVDLVKKHHGNPQEVEPEDIKKALVQLEEEGAVILSGDPRRPSVSRV